MKRAIVLALLLYALTTLAQNIGTITLYRRVDHRRGWKPVAFCDGQRIAAMQGGKYATLTISGGKHVFTSNNPKTRVEIDVKPGEQYFIRVEGSTGPFDEHGELELVPGSQARSEIDRLEPLPAKEVSAVCAPVK